MYSEIMCCENVINDMSKCTKCQQCKSTHLSPSLSLSALFLWFSVFYVTRLRFPLNCIALSHFRFACNFPFLCSYVHHHHYMFDWIMLIIEYGEHDSFIVFMKSWIQRWRRVSKGEIEKDIMSEQIASVYRNVYVSGWYICWKPFSGLYKWINK